MPYRVFALDIQTLINDISREREGDNLRDSTNIPRIVVGSDKDPRVSSLRQWNAPSIEYLSIEKDILLNPYVKIVWKMKKSDINAGKIKSFKIYRKKLSELEIQSNGRFIEKVNYQFTPRTISQFNRGIPSRGKFSNENPSTNFISNESIPEHIKNFGQYLSSKAEEKVLEKPIDYGQIFASKNYKEIAEVNIQQFLRKERRKLVFVENKNILNLSFSDKAVEYNSLYEYFITSVNENGQESASSEKILLKIDDAKEIPPPILKILTDKRNLNNILRAQLIPEFNISYVLLFRKERDALNFKFRGKFENRRDCVEMIDKVQIGKKYSYRVFAVDPFGEVSQPAEYIITPTNKKVVPYSRFNNLRDPIIKTEQDEGGSNVLIKIYPNDTKILFYKLQRKDLTTKERDYSVPSKDNTNYGGTLGWDNSGVFFVKKANEAIKRKNAKNEEINKANLIKLGKEISFVDATTTPGHIYSYRTIGYDLFNNPTSYAFSLISIEGKAALEKPESIRYQIIRNKPLRIKLLWDHQIKSGIKYFVQRRKEDELSYETFPATENRFIFDEIKTPDFLDFIEGQRDVNYLPDKNESPEDIPLSEIRRPRNMPSFLEENSVYYYRIISETQLEGKSGPTEEVKVYTYRPLARPIDVKASINNIKIRPLFVRLDWNVEDLSSFFKPDKFVIERKEDTQNSRFVAVGESYIKTSFFDYSAEFGQGYIYRIVAKDVLNREKTSTQVRVSLI